MAEDPVVYTTFDVVGVSCVPGDRFDWFVEVLESVATQDGFPGALVGFADDLVGFLLRQFLVGSGVFEGHAHEVRILGIDGGNL